MRVLAANRSFYKTFKVTQKDTLGNQVYDLGNRQWDIPGLRTLLETILPGKAVFDDYEVEHDFPFIGKRTLLLNARRIPAPPKAAQWILLAFEDVSVRRQLERALQASEERFHRAFETAHDGMLLIEKSAGLIVNSNQSAEQSLGYSKQSLKKKHLWELGILKDEDQFTQTAADLEAQGLVGLPDITIPTRRGGYFFADVYLMDKAAVIQCNIRDISERKLTEEKIKRQARIMDQLQECIIVTDLNNRIVLWNQGAERLLGYTVAETLGQPLSFMYPQDGLAFLTEEIQPQVRKKGWHETELRFRNKSGQEIPVLLLLSMLKNTKGEVTGMVGSAVDIRARKQAEAKILQLNASLEERVALRTRELQAAQQQLVRKEKMAVLGALAGGVGHELRNPLGAISNSIYYLKMVQPDASEKIMQHHAIIEQEVHNAAQIVSDLLDYARVIPAYRKAGSVADLVEHALSRFPVPASIHLSLKIPASLEQVYADPLHVEQVLGNLIINACHSMTTPSLERSAGAASLSESGKLTITARALAPVSATRPESSTGSDRQKPMLAISVKDTGTGIAPENMEKLFQALFTTKAKGIGLGLAVSQKLAEANGGKIEVESEVGKGSLFMLYLPILGSEMDTAEIGGD